MNIIRSCVLELGEKARARAREIDRQTESERETDRQRECHSGLCSSLHNNQSYHLETSISLASPPAFSAGPY